MQEDKDNYSKKTVLKYKNDIIVEKMNKSAS